MSQASSPSGAAAGMALLEVADFLAPLTERFAAEGFEIALVGGPVRDLLLGRGSTNDLDLTTDARPEQIERLVTGWADAVWDVGMRFGTVGARKGDRLLEITMLGWPIEDGGKAGRLAGASRSQQRGGLSCLQGNDRRRQLDRQLLDRA